MLDLLGREIYLGDVIAFNVNWEGTDFGVVRNITSSGVTYVDIHNNMDHLKDPRHCVIIDTRYQAMRYEQVLDNIAGHVPPASPDPFDVLHRPIAIGDMVTFGKNVAGPQMMLGRVLEIWDFEPAIGSRSRIRLELFHDNGVDEITTDGQQVALVDSPYKDLATPLLKDLFSALNTKR